MKRIRSHIFRGKRWLIRWRKLPGAQEGECESPASQGKMIKVDPRTTKLRLLDTLIHEGLHACMWDLDEEAVHESASDIAKLLWRLGYRLPGEPE